MAEILPSPYVLGDSLEIHIQDPGPHTIDDASTSLVPGQTLSVRIDELFTQTMSVVLKVSLLQENVPAQGNYGKTQPMILKLYDRRFAKDLREEKEAAIETTVELEHQFRTFLESGRLPQFLAQMEDIDPLLEEDDLSSDEDPTEKEACVYDSCTKMHKSEVQVYSTLSHMQGRYVPRFFADVRLRTSENGSLAEYLDVRGVLIEYIDGFSLSDLCTALPEGEWAALCDDAVEGIKQITDHNFINSDVKLRNAIVHKRENGDNSSLYQVFFIDFGLCYYRSSTDTDEMWRERKRQRDEEGAIGCMLEQRISFAKGKKGKRYKGPLPLPWSYHPSNRFDGEEVELY